MTVLLWSNSVNMLFLCFFLLHNGLARLDNVIFLDMQTILKDVLGENNKHKKLLIVESQSANVHGV